MSKAKQSNSFTCKDFFKIILLYSKKIELIESFIVVKLEEIKFQLCKSNNKQDDFEETETCADLVIMYLTEHSYI